VAGFLVVLVLAHPVGLLRRLDQFDEVIAHAERLALGEVGAAPSRTMLLEDPIDAPGDQFREQEIGRVERVPDQDLARLQRIEDVARQRQLVAALADTGSDSHIAHGSAAQAHQRDQPRLGKPEPLLLAAGLGVGGLIFLGIGEGHRGPIDQDHPPVAPQPPAGRLVGNDVAALPRQGGDHRHGQARTRLAVGAGVRVAGLEARDQPLDHSGIDRLLAAPIRRQDLGDEHRQRLGRRIQPLAVLGQHRLDPLQQLGAGQQVEHGGGIGVAGVAAHALLLPRCRALASLHVGWLLGWLWSSRNLQPTIRDGQPSIFS
jgi:hypothetical protein